MIISNLCRRVSEWRATFKRCFQSACRECRVALELVMAGRMLQPRTTWYDVYSAWGSGDSAPEQGTQGTQVQGEGSLVVMRTEKGKQGWRSCTRAGEVGVESWRGQVAQRPAGHSKEGPASQQVLHSEGFFWGSPSLCAPQHPTGSVAPCYFCIPQEDVVLLE